MDDETLKPKPPKRRRTRDQLQARAQASARHRAKMKATGLPTAAQIDGVIAVLFVRLLAKRKEIRIPSDYLPELALQVMRWGRWEHLGTPARRAIDARISKLETTRRPDSKRVEMTGQASTAEAEPS